VSSFVKNNRKKLKELASSYNPAATGPSVSRFIFSKDNSNDAHSKDESSQSALSKQSTRKDSSTSNKNLPNKTASQSNEQKGKIFSFLSQSKFGTK
jgi:hypothetical protein